MFKRLSASVSNIVVNNVHTKREALYNKGRSFANASYVEEREEEEEDYHYIGDDFNLCTRKEIRGRKQQNIMKKLNDKSSNLKLEKLLAKVAKTNEKIKEVDICVTVYRAKDIQRSKPSKSEQQFRAKLMRSKNNSKDQRRYA